MNRERFHIEGSLLFPRAAWNWSIWLFMSLILRILLWSLLARTVRTSVILGWCYLTKKKKIAELPLDNGVHALLRGCTKLRRFALYLRPGGLTDVGLGYIGQYSSNIRWMLLGHVGESDFGLLQFSRGCPKLQKLELRGCCFSEHALALAALQLASLRYLWVQGYNASPNGNDLLGMVRPFWNIEFIPPRQESTYAENDGERVEVGVEHPAQILAYYSLAGPRTDCPNTVIPLIPAQGVYT